MWSNLKKNEMWKKELTKKKKKIGRDGNIDEQYQSPIGVFKMEWIMNTPTILNSFIIYIFLFLN